MEFLQSFTKSAAAGIEDYMLLCVKVYSIFVTEPREIPVQVSGNAQGQMDFIGGDLLTVHSLRLKQSNPVAQTTAGRMGMAEQFLQAGLIKSPLEYQQILNTGSIEAAMDDGLDEQDLINKENDALRRGSKVDTFEHDMHEAHVMAHRHVLADPELRRKALAVMEDPMKFGGDEAAMAASMVVQSAVNHIADHVKWIQTKQPQAPQMPPPAAPKPPAPQGAPNGNPV
jgi:hypothetical protein